MDIRVVNLRTELPPFYRKLGYVWPSGRPKAQDSRLKTRKSRKRERPLP
jgi:hypothetical protein